MIIHSATHCMFVTLCVQVASKAGLEIAHPRMKPQVQNFSLMMHTIYSYI